MADFTNTRYLLFDLDGTLIDSQEGIFNGVRYAADRLGIDRPGVEILRRFVGPALHASFQEFFGLSSEKAGEAVTFYREYYNTAGFRQCLPYPGIESLLNTLKRQKRPAALATKKPESTARRILENLGLEHTFAAICGAEPAERDNRKEHILQRALDQLGVLDKSQAVMIGDTWYDCEGARRAGILCIGVLYGFGDETSLREHGAAAIAADMPSLFRLLCGREEYPC